MRKRNRPDSQRYPRERIARLVAGSYLTVVAGVMTWVALAMFVLSEPGDPVFDVIFLYAVTAPTSLLWLPVGTSLSLLEEQTPQAFGLVLFAISAFVVPTIAALIQASLLWRWIRGAPQSTPA